MIADYFLFKAAKKGLSHCIVVTVASATHACLKLMLLAKSLPFVTAIL
jgi:hypothetical protein